jgi:hypothetical protein
MAYDLNQYLFGTQGTVIQGATGATWNTGGTGSTGPGTQGIGTTGFYFQTQDTGTGTGTVRAGFENQDLTSESEIKQNENNIRQNFYKRLFHIFEDEEQSKIKTKQFFNINTQLDRDPIEYLQPGEYYELLISYFYMNFEEKQENTNKSKELWLRSKTNFYQINLIEKSGSIYQSPYDYNQAFILIGKSETDGMCVCYEETHSISFLSPYYFSRSLLVHDVKNSVMRVDKWEIEKEDSEKKVCNNISKLILEGKLSDDEIYCSDGKVKISKSILALQSNYFLYLFSNDSFKKQESYKIDFSKSILEYYIQYCCHNKPQNFDAELTMNMIEFGDFIQDKRFLQNYYLEIYKHRELFTQKSLLEIVKIYQELSL